MKTGIHYKFLIAGRISCVFGILSVIALAVISVFEIKMVLPAPIAYFMLFSVMLMTVCLFIGFALDVMSHLMRHDMSAIIWLFVFTVALIAIQIAVLLFQKQSIAYQTVFYNGFVGAAALRGLWYLIGIRSYEIKK